MTLAVPVRDEPEPVRPWLHRISTRLAAVGDQLLVALANFALTLAVARAYGAEEVATFGIGLSAALILQAMQRHAVLIPLMLQTEEQAAGQRGGLLGQHCILLGFCAALGLAGIGFAAMAGASRFAGLVLGSFAALLMVYVQLEFARALLVKLGRPGLLLASAASYVAICLIAAVAAISGLAPFETVLILLALWAALHALCLMKLAERIHLKRGAALLLADLRRYAGWALLATGTYSGYNHLPLFILGAVAEPVHAAIFVASRSLLQPLQILLRGLDAADKAMFSGRAGDAHAPAAFAYTTRLALLYAAAAAALGITAAFFAEPLILIAFGGKFAGSDAAFTAWVPVYILLGASMPLESLIYARQSFRPYYLARGIASLAAIALAPPLIALWSETGAILACAAGALIATAGTVLILRRDTRP